MIDCADTQVMPREIIVEMIEPDYSRIILEPFARGLGHTCGNALRRILLAFMPGCAVVSARIEGVQSEYGFIEGIEEEASDILQNLKGLAIKLDGCDEAIFTLNCNQAGAVTAKNITIPPNAEIINPDHLIAHLDKRGKLNIEMTVKRGVGYQVATVNKTENNIIGELKMNVTFSPVLKVAYRVENTRVESFTDAERLIIELKTNRTLEPEAAIRQAVRILQQQLSVFSDQKSYSVPGAVRTEVVLPPILLRSIEDLGLPVRALNCLHSEQIFYIGDLVHKTGTDLMRTPNLGTKSLREIENALETQGLSLGSIYPGWPPAFLKDREIKRESKSFKKKRDREEDQKKSDQEGE